MSARRHRARGFILRVVLFLLLGAVVNVAVAWNGFRATDGRGYQRFKLLEQRVNLSAPMKELWRRRSSDGWFADPPSCRVWNALFASGWDIGVSTVESYMVRFDATEDELCELYRGSGSFRVEQIDAGFPFGAVRLERWQGNPTSQYFSPTSGHDGLTLNDWILPSRVLPIRFALNTLFYAATLWLLFAAPGRVRRWQRVRRGLCAKCAYPVGTSEVCTECGAGVKVARLSEP